MYICTIWTFSFSVDFYVVIEHYTHLTLVCFILLVFFPFVLSQSDFRLIAGLLNTSKSELSSSYDVLGRKQKCTRHAISHDSFHLKEPDPTFSKKNMSCS